MSGEDYSKHQQQSQSLGIEVKQENSKIQASTLALSIPNFLQQIAIPPGDGLNLQEQLLQQSLQMLEQPHKKEEISNQQELQMSLLNQQMDQGSSGQPGEGNYKRKNKKRVISNPNQNVGHWSENEHKTYINFLMAHKSIMESQDMKKTSKIFKLMSEIIGSRSPSQCRSHHQKFNPFTHHIKKRNKGAGRKRKELSNQLDNPNFPKKEEIPAVDPNILNSFFLQQSAPFCMPTAYPLLQDLGMGASCLTQAEDADKVNFGTIFDPMMMLQMLQQNPQGLAQHITPSVQQGLGQNLQNLPSQQNSLANLQQMIAPQMMLGGQDADNKFYNFSFIQAPLNLSINYIPHLFNNGEFNQMAAQNAFYENLVINDEQLQQIHQNQYGEILKNNQQ